MESAAAAVGKDAGAEAQMEAGERAERFLGIWRASTRRRRRRRRPGVWARRGRGRQGRRWKLWRPPPRPRRSACASQGRQGGWPRRGASAPP